MFVEGGGAMGHGTMASPRLLYIDDIIYHPSVSDCIHIRYMAYMYSRPTIRCIYTGAQMLFGRQLRLPYRTEP